MFVSSILGGLQRLLARRRAFRELADMDDRQLEDIGVSRLQIARVVAIGLGSR